MMQNSGCVQRSITVLGATGSIGTSTLDIVARHPERFRVEALTANGNARKLAELAIRFNASYVALSDPAHFSILQEALNGTGIECAAGVEAVTEAARRNSDMVMSAITGSAGLAPTMAAIERGSKILLANKEALVCAGELMKKAVLENRAVLLPVDSEHSAIFQVFDDKGRSGIHSLVLTASGGPFRGWTAQQMKAVTLKEALNHPRWSMGAKITVDSASMMNKGLELIEASYLFDMPEDRIDVVVHPQSIVHSMVNYIDGSVLAQLGEPDMRTPIAYAMGWPERLRTPVEPVSLARLGQLTFEEPDEKNFPCLALARQALRAGGSASVVLNAANEVAVDAFLNERIHFLDIASFVEDALASIQPGACSSIDEVISLDREVRNSVKACIKA
ncbi:1-deoxy-D-xylulose-5-phosphate reductoisomerase [Kiloniella sp. b19]|uniref:1-deoxy-D-xylulose-5-phosphate reductoisomerase n=1 Tax=Kiloniella sp. GXU_MW_B19 TaxID=3141326 RepID=UPI0031D02A47